MANFGVQIFPTDQTLQPIELARAVEERGLDSLFFPEHTHIPVARTTPFPGGTPLPEWYWRTHILHHRHQHRQRHSGTSQYQPPLVAIRLKPTRCGCRVADGNSINIAHALLDRPATNSTTEHFLWIRNLPSWQWPALSRRIAGTHHFPRF